MATTHDADLTAVAASLVDDTTRTVFRDLLAGALQDLIEAGMSEDAIVSRYPSLTTKLRRSRRGGPWRRLRP